MQRIFLCAGLGAVFVLSACSMFGSNGPEHQRPRIHREAFHPPNEQLLKYDANGDGTLTAAEFNAGVRADFAAADTNHDGVLDVDEMRAVNTARWSANASAATPLIDWNQDGHIDLKEFFAAPRAAFDQLDRNQDDVLTPDELNPPHRPHVPSRVLPHG